MRRSTALPRAGLRREELAYYRAGMDKADLDDLQSRLKEIEELLPAILLIFRKGDEDHRNSGQPAQRFL
jgi:hypothetical protein